MPGFNNPHQRPTNPLSSAAHRAGLTLRQRDGQLFLCRFGHRIQLFQSAGRWWIHTPDDPEEEAAGPLTDETALMQAAAEVLDALSARSREPLVRGVAP
ncbi:MULTISPECIES: hypothetical protein [unclassified Nocardiopsis]|uniref:hypothetical protein n=1 Tax=unclassified Nocardiopsis TaxID=2649073 RepID=UPI00135911B3|nr:MULTISPECIES: hypothetical protein [unclassified Nocardiopsis]